MKKYTYITLFVILSQVIVSCKEAKDKNITIEDIKFTKEAELTIFKFEDSTALSYKTLDIEIAENDYERETGLMHRQSMQNLQGMLFVFEENRPQSFYMKNTLIPLDLVFISEAYKIVNFQKNAEPLNENSLTSGIPAKYVLEINAGLSDAWDLKVGDSHTLSKNKISLYSKFPLSFRFRLQRKTICSLQLEKS